MSARSDGRRQLTRAPGAQRHRLRQERRRRRSRRSGLGKIGRVRELPGQRRRSAGMIAKIPHLVVVDAASDAETRMAMKLHELKPAAGRAQDAASASGAGPGPGRARPPAAATRARSRAAATAPKRGFEGGQMPLHRRRAQARLHQHLPQGVPHGQRRPAERLRGGRGRRRRRPCRRPGCCGRASDAGEGAGQRRARGRADRAARTSSPRPRRRRSRPPAARPR